MNIEMIRVNKVKLKSLVDKYRLDLVIIFGSQVTGLTGKDSDIDIAVRRLNGPLTAREEIQLIKDLCKTLDIGNLDLVFINRADSLLLFEIASFGKLLYERKKDAFINFQIYAVKRNNDARKFYQQEEYYLKEKIMGEKYD